MVIWHELASVINQLGAHEEEADWVPLIIGKLLEEFEPAGFVNSFNFTAHRRVVIRPVLPAEYKRLASESFSPGARMATRRRTRGKCGKDFKRKQAHRENVPKNQAQKGRGG